MYKRQLIGLFKLFSRSSLILEKHDDYVLTLNTNDKITAIDHADQIAYTKNYLNNTTLSLHIELTNKEAFKLFKNQATENIKVLTAYTKTSFLEENPKEWFKSLMSMAHAAS